MKTLSLWKMISVSAILTMGLCIATSAAFAGDDNNGAVGDVPSITTPKATNGSVKCTASINSDGSVLACKHCNPADTMRVAAGQYQVGFKKPCQNILAVNGWSRWVQPDTLTTGSELAFCTSADRLSDSNAVFVKCFDETGTPVDASFFLFVAR